MAGLYVSIVYYNIIFTTLHYNAKNRSANNKICSGTRTTVKYSSVPSFLFLLKPLCTVCSCPLRLRFPLLLIDAHPTAQLNLQGTRLQRIPTPWRSWPLAQQRPRTTTRRRSAWRHRCNRPWSRSRRTRSGWRRASWHAGRYLGECWCPPRSTIGTRWSCRRLRIKMEKRNDC